MKESWVELKRWASSSRKPVWWIGLSSTESRVQTSHRGTAANTNDRPQRALHAEVSELMSVVHSVYVLDAQMIDLQRQQTPYTWSIYHQHHAFGSLYRICIVLSLRCPWAKKHYNNTELKQCQSFEIINYLKKKKVRIAGRILRILKQIKSEFWYFNSENHNS